MKRMIKVRILFVIFCGLAGFSLYCEEPAGFDKPDEEGTPKLGNLSLSSSQTPGPLFSFGHIVFDKGDKLFFLYPTHLQGANVKETTVLPFAIFGLRDDLALLIALPISPNITENRLTSSGVGDMTFELEYEFYSKVKDADVWQSLSFDVALSVPTGSDTKVPPVGLGSPSVLTGLTFDRIGIDWYFESSQGIIWSTKNEGFKYGNEYLYQFGLGKNIAYKSNKWIFSALIELLGTVTGHNQLNGIPDPNTGGNIIYLAPSLWFSTQRLIVQAGLAGVILQDLNGVQDVRDRFIVTVGAGWKF